ncbi:MAG: hypothetical protein IJT66_03750 [Clostridia bacterium]|nr:hypothetical protein [Clostridia bacterium]
MTEDEMILHIKEDKTVRLEIREKGRTRTKLISPDALFECIKGSIKQEPVFTGLLPRNILSLKIAEDGKRYAVVEYAYEKADIQYMETIYPDFPLPRLLFGFTLETGGRISGINLGVPTLGKLKEDTQMYLYPFSNVSRFRLCTGANSLPGIKNLQGLQNLPDYILSLPDNDDYFDASHNRLGLSHRDLLEHLRDKDRQYYYDHVLLPMPNTTLKNFL